MKKLEFSLESFEIKIGWKIYIRDGTKEWTYYLLNTKKASALKERANKNNYIYDEQECWLVTNGIQIFPVQMREINTQDDPFKLIT